MKVVSNFFASIPPFFSELAGSLSGEMDCSTRTLTEYSTDGGMYSVRPQAVIYPKTVNDIKQVIIFAREYGMPISICGGRSGQNGGALTEGMVIDMTRHFNHIRRANIMEHTVTVDAGVSLKSLSQKLRAWNMEIPVINDSDETTTVGGLIATKSTTQASFHHGTIREWIEGMTVILDNGEEHHITDGITPSGRLLAIYQAVFPLLTKEEPMLRASKKENKDDASGYQIFETTIGPRQLLDQITGSEGTLAIITSVTLRVRPKREHELSSLLILSRDKLPLAIRLLKDHGVEELFFYDNYFRTYAEKTYPKLAALWRTPQEEDTVPTYTLLATFYGKSEESVKKKTYGFIQACLDKNIAKEERITPIQKQMKDLLTAPLFAEHILEKYVQGTTIPFPLINGVLATEETFTTLIHDIEEYLFSISKLYTLHGNAGSYHIAATILVDPQSRMFEDDMIRYTNDIYKLVKKHKAGIGGSGGDGYAKTPYLPLFYNEATIDIFKKIKEIWDPHQILNPSKKTELPAQFLKAHLRRVL